MNRGADGRFVPGNTVAAGNKCGEPRVEDAERIAASLAAAISVGTLEEWVLALKRKLERAHPRATEVIWNRMLGKLRDRQEVTGSDGDPLNIIIRHVRVPYPNTQAQGRTTETRLVQLLLRRTRVGGDQV